MCAPNYIRIMSDFDTSSHSAKSRLLWLWQLPFRRGLSRL